MRVEPRKRTTDNLRGSEPHPQNALKPGCDRTAEPTADFAPPVHLATAGRPLVFHYHLFKNAGTSIDDLLRSNFRAHWAVQEFHVGRQNNAAAVAEFVRTNPQLEAISSHTALLPVPQIDGVKIFSIIFVRHPIDRLRSAYEFERRQDANTPGARLAKMHDFAGYILELLNRKHHRQVRNFQTFRLSHNEPRSMGSELDRAIRATETLSFVGLVERYEQSIETLERKLRPAFPRFQGTVLHRNAAPFRTQSLEVRLAATQEILGAELFARLSDANQDDMAIYNLIGGKDSL